MKAGRKPKYEVEDLKQKLSEYISNNLNKKIKLSDLERETDIPRHIWRDNSDIYNLIQSLNDASSIPLPKTNILQLPTAKEFVEKHYGDKQRLISDVQVLLEMVSDLYDVSQDIRKISEIKKSYDDEIKDLKEQLKLKDKEIEKLNKEIDSLYLDSENPTIRNKKGIVKNKIEVSSDNVKVLSKDIKDIESEYGGLF